MIPRDYITEWRAHAPWVQDIQVEQDLVICRGAHRHLLSSASERRARVPRRHSPIQASSQTGRPLFRGHRSRTGQGRGRRPHDAGPALRSRSVAGRAALETERRRVTFVYRFDSEDTPPIRLRLKVEINSREHFTVHGFTRVPFAVSSRWFEGSCQVTSYELDELLGTKLRALYQRRKGRDLFDLATALKNPAVDPARIIAAFSEYMDQGGHRVTRELFERNLASKLHDPLFTADIGPLLAPGYRWDIADAAKVVSSRLIAILPG